MGERWVDGEAWYVTALRRELAKRSLSVDFFELDLDAEKKGGLMTLNLQRNKRVNRIATEWSAPDGLDEYLKPTAMVDSESPVVLERARELATGAHTPGEAIRSIFYFLRDEIRYGRKNLYFRASQVLEEGMGNCTNKSTVLVAMARALNIPARLHYYAIRKEGIKSVTHPLLYPLTPKVVALNCRADVYLDGSWVSLETELDPNLFKGLVKRGLMDPIEIDWDGQHDTTFLEPYTEKDLGVFVSAEPALDAFFDSLPFWKRKLVPLFWWLSNREIEKSRRAGERSPGDG